MEQGTISRKREIITALAVLIVIVAIVAAVTITGKKKSTSSTTTAVQTPPTTSSAPSAPNSTSTDPSSSATATSFKDGSYTATGSYESPGGAEQITVHVTLAGDVVTATSAQSGAGDPEAQEYQDNFIGGYKQQVVGKDISSIRLSRVSGSSLTSQGFNDAIAQIKQQAQA